jgi:hypothetical protein
MSVLRDQGVGIWHVVELNPGPTGHLEMHVYPEFEGERAHEESPLCWCDPQPDAAEPHVHVHQRKAEA